MKQFWVQNAKYHWSSFIKLYHCVFTEKILNSLKNSCISYLLHRGNPYLSAGVKGRNEIWYLNIKFSDLNLRLKYAIEILDLNLIFKYHAPGNEKWC